MRYNSLMGSKERKKEEKINKFESANVTTLTMGSSGIGLKVIER